MDSNNLTAKTESFPAPIGKGKGKNRCDQSVPRGATHHPLGNLRTVSPLFIAATV